MNIFELYATALPQLIYRGGDQLGFEYEYTPVDHWRECMRDKSNADMCIQELYERYPNIMLPCRPLVEGPAAAVVTEDDYIIAVASPTGEVTPVDEPVSIEYLPPTPPPLPPRPSRIPTPPPMPTVQISKVPGAEQELRKHISAKRAVGDVIDAQSLQKQLQELKQVSSMKAEVKESDWKEQIRQGVPLRKLNVEELEKERRRRMRERMLQENPMARHLQTIEQGVPLRKVDAELAELERKQRMKERMLQKDPMAQHLQAIERGGQLKKTGGCGYRMIWDPRLRKCVSVTPQTTPEDIANAITSTLETDPASEVLGV